MAVTHAMQIVRESQGLNDLTVHDLRRTERTRMAELRIPKEISARVLNRIDGFERGVHDESYNRYFSPKSSMRSGDLRPSWSATEW